MSQENTTIKCEELLVSSSPHIRATENVSKIMLKVILSLAPALTAAIIFFGWRALAVMVTGVIFCVGAEALWCFMTKKPVWRTIKDGSAAVTGLLLAMNLSAGIPFYVVLIGAFLAIWLGKQFYGGLGHNPFNPALVARVALLIAFPGLMTAWGPTSGMNKDNAEYAKAFYTQEVFAELEESGRIPDGVSCATPLGVAQVASKSRNDASYNGPFIREVDNERAYLNYFFGNRPGCLGEVSVFALLLGGIMLIYWKLINWRIPLCYIGTVALITGIIHYSVPGFTPSPLFHVLTGGLFLGAFFMATDMVTGPMTNRGSIVFAIGCGVITSSIRLFGNYPEGVSFSILIMNALVPLIDRFCSKRPFGYVAKRRKIAQ